MSLEQLLIHYGPIAVTVGAVVEGDLTLVLAGVVAHLGYFSFPVGLAAGTAGSLLGDSVWYTLGRLHGSRVRGSRFYRRVGPRIEQFARRFGPGQLLLTRFVYGTKNASMVFWGLHDLPFRRFVFLDGLGTLLGAAFFSGLGYLMSGGAQALLGRVRRIELWLLGGVLVGAVLVIIVHRTARRELQIGEADTEG